MIGGPARALFALAVCACSGSPASRPDAGADGSTCIAATRPCGGGECCAGLTCETTSVGPVCVRASGARPDAGPMCRMQAESCTSTTECCGTLSCGASGSGPTCCAPVGSGCSVSADCCGTSVECRSGTCVSCRGGAADCGSSSDCCAPRTCGMIASPPENRCCGGVGVPCSHDRAEDCCGTLGCVDGLCAL